jgi:hypothetical protein
MTDYTRADGTPDHALTREELLRRGAPHGSIETDRGSTQHAAP